MNRSIDKRLAALEARLLSPAVDTKLSIEGFDVDEYRRLMLEVMSRDSRHCTPTTEVAQRVRFSYRKYYFSQRLCS